MKKNVYVYNGVTFLYERNQHNVVNQLYFSEKERSEGGGKEGRWERKERERVKEKEGWRGYPDVLPATGSQIHGKPWEFRRLLWWAAGSPLGAEAEWVHVRCWLWKPASWNAGGPRDPLTATPTPRPPPSDALAPAPFHRSTIQVLRCSRNVH